MRLRCRWISKHRLKLIGRSGFGGLFLAMMACADVNGPVSDSDPVLSPDAIIVTGGEAAAQRQAPPSDDPRAWVFEDLGTPGARLDNLTQGQCVLQYRRWTGRYTPIPYPLRYDRGDGGEGPGVAVVLDLHRDSVLDVRATCVLPTAQASQIKALQDLERRIRERAFYRDENGGLQLYDPPSSASGLVFGWWRRSWGVGTRAVARLAGLLGEWSPAPAELHAVQQDPPPPPPPWLPEGCLYWEWDDENEFYYCGAWELDPIEATACQDENLVWDPATEQCVCPNPGEDPEAFCAWDPTDPEDPEPDPECEPSDPDYPDCDGGGGGSGGDDGGDDDPPPPPPASVVVYLSPSAVTPEGQTTVTVVVDPAIAGYPVELSVTAVPNSGGHQHTTGRPVGALAASSGTTSEIFGPGMFVTTYTASKFGGEERIEATVVGVTGTADLESALRR